MPHVDPTILDGILEDLVVKAPSDAVRTKLRNLNEVCKAFLSSGVKLTVPAVIAGYGKRYKGSGQSMAESSIRNKRGDENLYNRLYCAWADFAKANVSTRRRAGELISPDELGSIPDHALRHRIALTMADNHSLRSRLNILETVDKEHLIRIDGFTRTTSMDRQAVSAFVPDEEDLAALRDFLEPRKMKARGLVVRADGGLVSVSGHVIAEPGFIDALKSVTKNYGGA